MKKSVVKPREYKYTQLKSVKANTTVDVYGVVKFIKQTFKTKGKDYCMVVSLVDPSLEKEEKLKCVLFNNDPDKLPDLEIGNILRLHRLKINVFRSEFQGQSGPGFSWVVFENKKDFSFDPTSSCSANFTFTDSDRERVTDLRRWSTEMEVISNENKTIPLENVVPQIYFDFECQIVATCYFEKDNCFVLRVWDGTVTIYPLRKFDFEDFAVDGCDSLLSKSDEFQADVALYDEHVENARNKFKPGDFVKIVNLHAAIYKSGSTDIPVLELVLHRGNSYGRGIMLLNDIETLAKNLMNVNSSNIGKGQSKNNDCLNKILTDDLRPSTSKQADPDQEKSVKSGLKRPNPFSHVNKPDNKTAIDKPDNKTAIDKPDNKTAIDMVSSTSKERNQLLNDNQVNVGQEKTVAMSCTKTRCMQKTLTVVTGHQHIKVLNMVEVLSTPAPNKFHVVGHVKDIFPHHALDLVKLYCVKCNYLSSVDDNLSVQKVENGIKYYFCPSCETTEITNTLQYTYMMKFEIVDETGSLVALLWAKEAVTFFKDICPEDLFSNESFCQEIQEDLDQLCSSDKPLFECCIKSYSYREQTKYQMFDTCLI